MTTGGASWRACVRLPYRYAAWLFTLALNCQVTCMDAEGLGRRLAGRVCFWGEPDRQHTLPYGTPEQVHHEVRGLVTGLAQSTGGMIGLGTAMPDVPLANIEAMLAAWNASGEGVEAL